MLPQATWQNPEDTHGWLGQQQGVALALPSSASSLGAANQDRWEGWACTDLPFPLLLASRQQGSGNLAVPPSSRALAQVTRFF